MIPAEIKSGFHVFTGGGGTAGRIGLIVISYETISQSGHCDPAVGQGGEASCDGIGH